MTEEDKADLAAVITAELEDSAYGTATETDRERTALLVVDEIEPWLRSQGWMPPETYENVQAWAARTSHLTELAAILHDR
jgi:hypothetical protein